MISPLGIDDKLSLKNGTTAKYFLQDHLGSTVALTDSGGVVTNSRSYDSFGNATNSSFPSRYQYTGREYDPFSQFHYYRARWYDANLGRFITEDPIGFHGQSVNLYSYVKNNPVRFTDPSGKFPVFAAVIIGGGVVAIEGGLHLLLVSRANSISWPGADPQGRMRHCYVNCMSTRIHLGNPGPGAAAGAAQEAVNVGYQGGPIDDSVGDSRANLQGQVKAFVIWKSCEELCKTCQ